MLNSSFVMALGILAGLFALAASLAVPCWCAHEVTTTYTLSDFTDSSAWHITSLKGNTGASRLEKGVLMCDFSGKPGYIGLGGPQTLLGAPGEVSITFESNTSGHVIVLRFQDSQGQYFQKPIATLDSDGVRAVRVSLTDMGRWYHFGGPDDGTVRPPIKLVEVIVDHDGVDTAVRFLDLSVTTRIPVDQGLQFRMVGKERRGRSEILSLEARNILPHPVSARCDWRTTDLFGKLRSSGVRPLNIPAGASKRWSLTVPVEDVTLCELALTATVPVESPDGRAIQPLKPRPGSSVRVDTIDITRTVSASVVGDVAQRSDPSLLQDSPFGMGIYLGQRYSIAEMDRVSQTAENIGIKWMRDEFNWGSIQPVRGEWRWENYDAAVGAAQKHGVQHFGLLCYWAPWTKPYTSEGVKDYCDYVKAVVSRYKSRIKHWEIWNEPNIFFWQGTVEQYAELLEAAYHAVKEADPDAKVIGCCTAGTDLGFIEKVLKLGGYDNMDILSIHPYRYPNSPDESDFVGELKKADALVRKYGSPREIWITEIGWPTHTGANGSSEARQVAMIVRVYIQAIASGVVRKVFWYDYRNDGADPLYNEHNFGIVRRDLTPKPAYVAFGVMSSCLEGKKFVKDLSTRRDVRAYLFEGRGTRTIAAWCTSGSGTLRLSWPGAPKSPNATVRKFDLAGGQSAVASSKEGVSISVSELPVFVTGVGKDVRLVRADIHASPKASGDSVRVTVAPAGEEQFKVSLHADPPLKEALDVAVHIPGYSDSFSLPVRTRDHTETYVLPRDVRLGATEPLRVAVNAQAGRKRIRKESSVYYVPCPRAPVNPVIDGKVDEWDMPPVICLGNAAQFHALESFRWAGPDDLSAEMRTAWDDGSFYLAVRVRDDIDFQDKAGAETWQGDSIQIALDPLHLESAAHEASYEFDLAQTTDGPQVWRRYAPKGQTAGAVSSARLAVRREGACTWYEAAIPLSVLEPLNPRPGRVIGFSILVNDNDGNGRKGWLEWGGGIGKEKSPALFGDLTLVD